MKITIVKESDQSTHHINFSLYSTKILRNLTMIKNFNSDKIAK